MVTKINQPDARVVKRGDDLSCIVLGIIIDDDRFPVGKRLRAYRLQGWAEKLCVVVGWDDN